jgi:hypothetical protein
MSPNLLGVVIVGTAILGCRSSSAGNAIAYGAVAAAWTAASLTTAPSAYAAPSAEPARPGEPAPCRSCEPRERLGRDYGIMGTLVYWTPCSEDGTCEKERVFEYSSMIEAVRPFAALEGSCGRAGLVVVRVRAY